VAKAAPAQVSFNAGELSPRLEGRFDLAKYQNGCRELENFLPMVQGGAIKRSGTKHVSPVKSSSTKTRLIPFEFGAEAAYVLEFGQQYCRVLKDSGHVLESTSKDISAVQATTPIRITTTTNHEYFDGEMVYVSGAIAPATGINSGYYNISVISATVFQLNGTESLGAALAGGTVTRVVQFATTYLEADLATIQYAQSADVLYLAHPSYPPRKISRTSHTAWTITTIDWSDAPPFAQENLEKDEYMVASARTGSITLYSTGGRFTTSHAGGYVKLAENLEGTYPEWGPNMDAVTASTSNYARYEIDGDVFKTNSNILAHYEGRLYRYIDDHASTPCGGNPPLHDDGVQNDGEWDWEYVNSGYGWVEITAVTNAYVATGTVVRELGRAVSQTVLSISGITNASPPVVTTSANHGYTDGDQVFITGIALAALNNRVFTVNVTGLATFELVGESAAGVGGAVGSVVRVKSVEGVTTSTRPLRVAATRFSFGAFSIERGYPTSVAFFEDRLWWAGTDSDPQGLWASRTGRYEDHLYTDEDDGALFLLLNTQQVNTIEWLSAGKRLAIGTAGGEFIISGATEGPVTAGNVKADQHSYYGSRSVTPIRVESVTLFVQRSGRKLIEYGFDFESDNYQGQDLCVLSHHVTLAKLKELAWAQEPDRIVWACLEDGQLVAMTYDRQQEVVGWHRHVLGGVFGSGEAFVESLAVIPHPDGDSDQLWLVVKRTVNSATVRHIEILQKTWVQGTAIADGFFVDAGATYSGASTATIAGLWHLIGQSVYVNGNGTVQGPFTVSSTGTITLTTAVTKAQVGLSYAAVLQTMRVEGGGGVGTSQGKTGRIVNVVLRIEDTGTGLQYGPALDTYAITAGTLETGDTRELRWPGSSSAGGGHEQARRMNIRHAQPLPCTLIAMFPNVSVEG
jgi:hypothetical protein